MIRDSQTALWEAVGLSVGTAVSTNGYDLGLPPTAAQGGTARDPSVGNTLVVVLSVGVAAVVSAAETYEFDLIEADDAALTSNVDVLAKYPFTNTQATTLLKAGSIIVLPYPPGSVKRRYIGAQAVLSGGASAITVTAWIAPATMVQQTRSYSTLIQIL